MQIEFVSLGISVIGFIIAVIAYGIARKNRREE